MTSIDNDDVSNSEDNSNSLLENVGWHVIDTYFKDNPNCLVQHQLDSYNDFMQQGLKSVFKEKNPIILLKNQDSETKEYRNQCRLYLGGKNGDKIYYGKPTIYDNNERSHFMFPNEARLRNMTYGISIHYDVEVEYTVLEANENTGALEEVKETKLMEKVYLGRFPIMLMSNQCVLNGLTSQVRFNMGECKNDHGGYFIIDGKEKVVICQEKFADNMLYLRDKVNDKYSHSAEIRSISEDASKEMRNVAIRMVAPDATFTNGQIVVDVPNVRKPVPLFILMRALGVISDKEIIKHCLLDLKKNQSYMDLFVPSIHEASVVFTQKSALEYISTFTKYSSITYIHDILMNFFLPHVGEDNYEEKAYYVGYMVMNMLRLYNKEIPPTDRDSFKYKRVEVAGRLLYDLFKEYFTLQQKEIWLAMDGKYKFSTIGENNKKTYEEKSRFFNFVEENKDIIFRERIVETGFRKAFKGNWGGHEYTKKPGVVQPLNRLSYNSFISHLRKLNLPFDSSAKVIGPRRLHSSQWGKIDPVDTPDGGNVGLHKHLSITAHITSGCSGYPMIKWMRKHGELYTLEECSSEFMSNYTKVFVNGSWIGMIKVPVKINKKLHDYRRNALIPIFTSIHWNIETNELHIFTDSGRLCRPIFYMDTETSKPSYQRDGFLESIEKKKSGSKTLSWNQMIAGYSKKKASIVFEPKKCELYENIGDLYDGDNVNIDSLSDTKAVIEFIDTAEEECSLIAIREEDVEQSLAKRSRGEKGKEYTHIEIHPSLMFGVMGNQIVFPENNQLPRDLFSCGQSKQGVSLYHSNYQNRIDKMGVVLNYGQIPLVKSRYMNYINKEEHPYGENPIVAIMVYGSYNVEDSILFNEGSVKRGMFRTTYMNSYEAEEESENVDGVLNESIFSNIEDKNVDRLKPGYDYSQLDKYGMVKENTLLDDKVVLIGKVSRNTEDIGKYTDASIVPKKGQLGFVDKTFLMDDEEGKRLAKVRIREERIPKIGDKFCSRCGQKGTIGLIIPESDMPYTADGIKPDLIINPHAIPSRMTIGQLVECLMGKACASYGGFGDCTAFVNKGSRHQHFGEMLTRIGYHSSGTEILYNGMTGEQLQSQIFIGPTYYMRLKHMVKDKINYRARGPRTLLTRQTVQGRANNGGLRIGEMERDGILAHGASKFLQQSMMERGDEYYMAVCNKTGVIAIYNEHKNLFLSPQVDGPIQFGDNIENMEDLRIEKISKYGRSFSVLRIPYAFKLLMQELKSMNIQMRLITEENIDQMTSLSFSDNIKLLTHDALMTGKKLNELNEKNKKESVNAFKELKISNIMKRVEVNEQVIEQPLQPPSQQMMYYQPPSNMYDDSDWGQPGMMMMPTDMPGMMPSDMPGMMPSDEYEFRPTSPTYDPDRPPSPDYDPFQPPQITNEDLSQIGQQLEKSNSMNSDNNQMNISNLNMLVNNENKDENNNDMDELPRFVLTKDNNNPSQKQESNIVSNTQSTRSVSSTPLENDDIILPPIIEDDETPEEPSVSSSSSGSSSGSKKTISFDLKK